MLEQLCLYSEPYCSPPRSILRHSDLNSHVIYRHVMVIGWTENSDEQPPSDERPKVRAAIYVRMSTEHQKYSTDNQIAAIERYAAKHRFEIAWTYAGEGKSARYLGRVPKYLGASEGNLGNRSLHVAERLREISDRNVLFSCPLSALVLSLDASYLRRRAFGNAVDDRAMRALIGELQAIRIGLDEVLQTNILSLSRLRNDICNGHIRRVSARHSRHGNREANRVTEAEMAHPFGPPEGSYGKGR
ncbi:recombinase family protein [Ensifer sp. Root278]|uniref:recombinase family protein n=1 Tax=Ensifer sp. Root278 TaxID=1736509 RepID=UPI003298B611